jgi:plastocyanin
VGLLLAVAGCASSGSTGAGDKAAASTNTVTVTVNDAFRFVPSHITAHAGDVTVRLVASGSYPHNFSVPALHKTSDTVGTSIGAEHTTLFHLHNVKPGTYRFVCTFHSKAGMTGELVVQ